VGYESDGITIPITHVSKITTDGMAYQTSIVGHSRIAPK